MHAPHPRSDNGIEMVYELAGLKQAFEATVRERDWLRQELAMAREREQDYREQLAWLRRLLSSTKGLRIAPPPAAAVASCQLPEGSPLTTAPLTTDNSSQPSRRQQIRAWLAAHPGPHRRLAIEQGVGLGNLARALRHLVAEGSLTRVQPGVFQGQDPT